MKTGASTIFLAKSFLVERGWSLDALDFAAENKRVAVKVADVQ